MPIRIEGTSCILNAKTSTTGTSGLISAMARTFFSLPLSAAGIAHALRVLESRWMEKTIHATATTISGIAHSQE